MSIRINNIFLDLDEPEDNLKIKIAKKLRISLQEIKSYTIVKESIDARKKDRIKFNYSLEVNCKEQEKLIKKLGDKDLSFQGTEEVMDIAFGSKPMINRPIIVGMGPAGLFAGLIMAKNGYRPIIIERGEPIEQRTNTVNSFWKTGKLNTESNVQFGEGGAGTFSDGKLTTRIKDKRCDYILQEFVKAGAPKEILYMGKPHIGTDILKRVVINIRKQIIAYGGEVRFNSRLEGLKVKDGVLNAALVNGEEIPCENLLLAIGHSSRDTYAMLKNVGVTLTPKAFAIGVRVEHTRDLIDKNQYGIFAEHPKLRAANYKLTFSSEKTKRSAYSFCMCPGGEVVAASSEEGRLVVNGMSYYKRELDNSNSAIVVTVGPEDFKDKSSLGGIEFQRHYEKLAYQLGGGGYIAPVQLVEDFLKDRKSRTLGNVIPSYRPGYELSEIKNCLPEYVVDTLKEGFVSFDRKIKGFTSSGAVITGIETRTSAPVRIERNERLESINVRGLFPAGEGAGFAGGIISAAVDGLKCAENIMKERAPKN